MNNYPLHHKEKKQGLFTKVFVLILIIMTIIIIVRLFFPKSFTNIAQFVSAPFWKAKNLSIESVINSTQLLRSKRSLIFENDELKLKIKESEFKFFELDLLKQENESLKQLLGRQILNAENVVISAVLSRPDTSPYDTFVIDIGKDFGVKNGDSVYVSGNIFIGKIDGVYRNTSTVKLFSSPGEITSVSIGPQNISVKAKGRGGGNFIVELPRGTGVEKGDIITLPGIDIKLFAVVEEIESSPSDPFISIFFKNPINLNDIKWVYVVLSEN